MDGVGYPRDLRRSAVQKCNTKFLRSIAEKYPSTLLRASEQAVGLPKGQAGTSEVGHLTMGAGRTIFQPLERINHAIKDGSFFKNEELLYAMEQAKKGHALHLMGMPSDGGIHSHINHFFRLLDMAKENGVKEVYIHFFADGRDTPPKSVKKYIKQVENYIKKVGIGKIATIMGRYYALDRDKNWDRNQLAYEAMVDGKGKTTEDIYKAVDEAYAAGETDEFLKPIVITENGKFKGRIKDKDSVIFYNFRADRERQLTYVFVEKNDLPFVKPLHLTFVTLMEFDNTFKNCRVAYKPQQMENMLSEVLSKREYSQAKIAETEKYAHVTFFFNNGKQDTYPKEDRFLIASEKMASYANKPEMSAEKIKDKVLELISEGKYDQITINFANGDMVGHSGDMAATKIAVGIVDRCVKEVVQAVLKAGGQCIVTADHGNSDEMIYPDGGISTAHSTALVPCVVVGKQFIGRKLRKNGTLADIAPTILDMMGEDKPAEMTGKSLLI